MNLLRPLYLRARSGTRRLVKSHPAIDLHIGRGLVQVDLLLRRLGLVSVMDPDRTEFWLDGCRFRFDTANRALAEQVVSTGEYEASTLAAVRAHLGEQGGFIDLGANLGVFSVLAANALGPWGRVFAFEPTPTTARLLRANIEANGVTDRVTVIEQAVSDRPGVATFSLYGSAQGNQLASAGTEGAISTIPVAVTSLDAYFADLCWPRIDVIKMDVEGAELAVFDGMRELVRRYPRVRVIFEYHLGQLGRAHISGAQLIDRVRELGFSRFEVLFRGRDPIELPAELARLDRQARRANLNLLAWRE